MWTKDFQVVDAYIQRISTHPLGHVVQLDIPDLLVNEPPWQASGKPDIAGQCRPAGHSISVRESEPVSQSKKEGIYSYNQAWLK